MSISYTKGIFIKDKNTRGVYKSFKQPQQFPFAFLRVEPTKTDVIKNIGAYFVIQSFGKLNATDRRKSKILHSGLMRLNDLKDEIYFGDNLNLGRKRKDFFIIEVKNGILKMYYFKKRNPKNKAKFSKYFLQSVISK